MHPNRGSHEADRGGARRRLPRYKVFHFELNSSVFLPSRPTSLSEYHECDIGRARRIHRITIDRHTRWSRSRSETAISTLVSGESESVQHQTAASCRQTPRARTCSLRMQTLANDKRPCTPRAEGSIVQSGTQCGPVSIRSRLCWSAIYMRLDIYCNNYRNSPSG